MFDQIAHIHSFTGDSHLNNSKHDKNHKSDLICSLHFFSCQMDKRGHLVSLPTKDFGCKDGLPSSLIPFTKKYQCCQLNLTVPILNNTDTKTER